MDSVPHKTCNSCGVTKNISEFYRSSSAKDGRRAKCKKCCSLVEARYRDNLKKSYEFVNSGVRSKTCIRCGIEKVYSDFYVNRTRRDGRQQICKECSKQFNIQNKEQMYEYQIKNKERIATNKQEYRKKNKKKLKNANAKWYAENSEKVKENVKLWRETHPDAVSEIRHRYRARKKGSNAFRIDHRFIRWLYASSCVVCGSSKSIHADHVIPLSRGGRHSEGNLQPLCQRCNTAKGAKLMMEFRMSRPDLFALKNQ